MYKLQDRVKATRKLKGLTQGDLADSIGLTTSAISAIEIGKTSPPDTIKKVAEKLKVDYNWLLNGVGDAPDGLVMQSSRSIENPWEQALVKQLKEENLRLWKIVEKFTGPAAANFLKSPKTASAFLRVIHRGAFLGDQLSKVA